MAITLFGTASNPADNGSANEPVTSAVTPPGSMVANDGVLLIGEMRTLTGSLMSQSALGGQSWTTILDGTGAGQNSVNFAIWLCTYNGTWSANPSIAFASTAGTVTSTAIMLVFRGVTSWAVDVAVSALTAFSGGTLSPSRTELTTAHANALAVALFATSSATDTWGSISGAGWSQAASQWRNTAGSGSSVAAAYQSIAVSGTASGNVALTRTSAVAGADLIFSVSGTIAGATRPVKMAGTWGGFASRGGGFAARPSGLMVPAHLANDNAERLVA